MRETFTTPDGRTLAYERRGSGPLLVCHPGGPGGSAARLELAADFAKSEPLHYFNTVEFPTLDFRGKLRAIEAPTLVSSPTMT